MNLLTTIFAIVFVGFQVSANVDVLCDCKGPVVYAGKGQVAGSGVNINKAMEIAQFQCLNLRGGQYVDRCDSRSAKSNPSILCQCKVGLFNKGQVAGAGPTLNEAFAEALANCESNGLSSGALNGLLACKVL